MPSWTEVLTCSAFVLCFYSYVGFSLAKHVASPQLALLIAPAFGWAVHTAAVLPVLMIVGTSREMVFVLFAAPAVAAIISLHRASTIFRFEIPSGTNFLITALACAVLLATLVTVGVMPKVSADGVTLAAPIFDHSKVAIVDEIVRFGVPPGNPFFATTPSRLTYYYLWHFSAAEFALIMNTGGWAADAAFTWFTAFASLSAMIGFAAWISGRASAGVWITVLAATATIRPLLDLAFGVKEVEKVAGVRSGFGGWFFQTSWAPQHVASAVCTVLAIYLIVQVARRPGIVLLLTLATVMAAGFESSTWVGGSVFPLAAVPIALVLLVEAEPPHRLRITGHLAAAVLLALLLISPLLLDQFYTAGLRGGHPIGVTPFKVLGDDVIGRVGLVANWAAYWLIFLIVEFPAFYIAGLVGTCLFVKDATLDADRRLVVRAFATMLGVSLLAAWLLVSTLAENNDLGWRAVLPAVFMLMIFAAAGIARLTQRRLSFALAAALILIVLGLPDAFLLMRENVIVAPNPTSKSFAATPALWEAVRRVSGPDERVANNPEFLERATPWQANISWALLSDRRSCYAGQLFMEPFTTLSAVRLAQIKTQFVRVFSGDADAEDVATLVTQYECNVVVLTPQDGAWNHDPFAASSYYRLADASPAWRIYKTIKMATR